MDSGLKTYIFVRYIYKPQHFFSFYQLCSLYTDVIYIYINKPFLIHFNINFHVGKRLQSKTEQKTLIFEKVYVL